MTTIISRLYPSTADAEGVMADLVSQGHDAANMRIITADAAGAAPAAMKRARVGETEMMAYSKAMTAGQALLVAEVGFSPIGAARNAIKTVNRHPSINVGLAEEDRYIRESPQMIGDGSVFTSHPLIMSNPFRSAPHGHILGNNPVITGRRSTSAMSGGGYMSKAFWPMNLISPQRPRSSAIHGGFLFSAMFGLPLLLGR